MGRYDWTVSCSADVDNAYSSTQAKVTVYAKFNNVGWDYVIGYRAKVACDGQESSYWTGVLDSTGVGSYGSVNVGSKSFIVNKGENARNITCQAWIKDNSGNAYAGGYERTGSVTKSIAALPKYTISFNANGGSGAPAAITKSHGIAKNLPTGIPTRSGYEFLGWATSASGSAAYSAGASYNGNANATLYAVWKALASTSGAKTFTIGDTVTLSWTRYVSGYTHTIKYAYGNASGTIATGAGTSCSWTIPMSLCEQTPNATSGKGTWTIETYNGSTLIGKNTYTLNLNVPASVVPTFTYTLSNENSHFNSYSTVYSKLKAEFSVAGAYGSTVQSASVIYDDITYSGRIENDSATVRTNELNITGTRPVVLTIVDSRGRIATVTTSITVYEYNNPRVDELDVDVYGNVATINVSGVIAPVNNENQKFITVKKVRTSDEQETTIVPRTALSNYNFNQTYQQTISDIGTETYNFIVIIEDKVNSTTANHLSGIVCISRLAGGKGVRLFKEAEEEGFWVGDIDYTITTDEYIELAWDLATPYSSLSTYTIGLFVTNNSHLYECNTPITSPESWTPSHWTLLEQENK